MKRFLTAFLALAMVFALASVGGTALAASDMVGTYKMTDMVSEGEAMSAEELEAMEQFGLSYSLYLYEDGTGSLVVFGQGMDLTWDDSTITIAGLAGDDEDALIEAIEYTRDGDTLTLEVEGTVITFTKTSDEVEIPQESMSTEDLLMAIIAAMMASDEPADEPTEEPVDEPIEDPSGEPAEDEYYAEPLAEGDIGDYHVAIVGAEPFTDIDGKNAVRFYYEFTNNSEEPSSAYVLTFDAEEEEYELIGTYATYEDDAPEYGNDSLSILPGAMILCEREFKFKPTGHDLVFTISDWYSGDAVSYTFEDPSDLPGRPMEWKPVKVSDPQTYIDYPLSGECEDFAVSITDAEVVACEGEDVIRVYFEVTNNTGSPISAMWLVSLSAYQDGIELKSGYADEDVPEDDAYYESIEPGDTMLVSYVWKLRTDSPVEATFGYSDYFESEVLCAATISVAE